MLNAGTRDYSFKHLFHIGKGAFLFDILEDLLENFYDLFRRCFMNGFEIIGYMAGLFTAVCFMPQSIKTLRTRETKGISAVSYALFSLGLVCWIIYGVYLHSVQMILFNAISLFFSLSILVVTLRNLKIK